MWHYRGDGWREPLPMHDAIWVAVQTAPWIRILRVSLDDETSGIRFGDDLHGVRVSGLDIIAWHPASTNDLMPPWCPPIPDDMNGGAERYEWAGRSHGGGALVVSDTRGAIYRVDPVGIRLSANVGGRTLFWDALDEVRKLIADGAAVTEANRNPR